MNKFAFDRNNTELRRRRYFLNYPLKFTQPPPAKDKKALNSIILRRNILGVDRAHTRAEVWRRFFLVSLHISTTELYQLWS